jgi:hypothetical protein
VTIVRNVFETRPRLPNPSGLFARARLATRHRPSWWRDEWDDQVLFLAVALIWTAWTWRRDKQVKQRLADVVVPNGIAVTVLCFVLARQRARTQSWHEASASLGEVSRALTAQRLEGAPARGDALPELQASVASLTKQTSDRDEQLVTLNEQVGTLDKRVARLGTSFAAAALVVVVLAASAAIVLIVRSH